MSFVIVDVFFQKSLGKKEKKHGKKTKKKTFFFRPFKTKHCFVLRYCLVIKVHTKKVTLSQLQIFVTLTIALCFYGLQPYVLK